jgi:BirA family transcriptional regulator, biotin operon repressor / biotin---[acetyl-CoA-carboxylase] ligase
VTDDPGWLIQRFETVASTMDVASQFARFGARERTAVVSTEQTAGRGRGGRTWQAVADRALFATLILRPPVAAHQLSTLPLMVGVAVAETVERISGSAVWLKWPNDVWLGEGSDAAKVAGILVTSSLRGENVDHVLIGIGINVLGGAHDLPPGATTIQSKTGATVTPNEVLRILLERFADAYTDFVETNGRPSLAGWLARAALLGEMVTVEEAGRSITGKFVGVDEVGALLIDDPGLPVRRVVAGDLVRGPRAACQPE